MARDFARIERYEALRTRLRDLVERRFHHNRAEATDLDELERTIGRLEALVLVEPGQEAAAAQAAPAPVKAEASPPPKPAAAVPKPAAKAAAAKAARKVPKRGTRPKAPASAPKAPPPLPEPPATEEAAGAAP